jgi:hypothetical protein
MANLNASQCARGIALSISNTGATAIGGSDGPEVYVRSDIASLIIALITARVSSCGREPMKCFLRGVGEEMRHDPPPRAATHD